jgi:hypothetical protein
VEFQDIAKKVAGVDTLDTFLRDMRARYPDAALPADASKEAVKEAAKPAALPVAPPPKADTPDKAAVNAPGKPDAAASPTPPKAPAGVPLKPDQSPTGSISPRAPKVKGKSAVIALPGGL